MDEREKEVASSLAAAGGAVLGINTELAKLRAELEQVKRERDANVEAVRLFATGTDAELIRGPIQEPLLMIQAGNVKAAALDKFADVVKARNEDVETIRRLRAELVALQEKYETALAASQERELALRAGLKQLTEFIRQIFGPKYDKEIAALATPEGTK